jgi:hypothetical protein
MITNPQELRALTYELTLATWTLAALGALFESGLAEHLREPRSLDELASRCTAFSRDRIERELAVAATAGVVVAEGGDRWRLAEGVMPLALPPMRAVVQGEIRSTLMQAIAFLDSAGDSAPRPGWTHTDRALLQAQGDASGQLPGMLKMHVIPALGDLGARLERPEARFLDVGVGVGALSISMCRTWPAVRAVGLDVFDPPLAIARENVARAGLGDRIELRKVGVEDLADEDAFDFAWLPGFFVPPSLLERALARVRAALRPGGWMLTAVLGGADDRARAIAGLMTNLWGGPSLPVERMQSLLGEAGFSTVRVMPGPPWAPSLVVGQR